jgi:three-Cys-motif partner protein
LLLDAFKTIYVDAFAGTGQRRARTTEYSENLDLFGESEDQDRSSYKRGSVEVALGLENPFDRYIFVEINTSKARQLQGLITDKHSHLEQLCAVEQADANAFLQQWCAATNWETHRAVVFLDPFGMNVEWKTIESIAKAQAIDMWTLFPIGAGVNRMLTKGHRPLTGMGGGHHEHFRY